MTERLGELDNKGEHEMTAQPQWGQNYIQMARDLVKAIENARGNHDMATQDSALFSGYLNSPNARTDITEADMKKADDAIWQIIFAYDSGSPTQKAAIFKIL